MNQFAGFIAPALKNLERFFPSPTRKNGLEKYSVLIGQLNFIRGMLLASAMGYWVFQAG